MKPVRIPRKVARELRDLVQDVHDGVEEPDQSHKNQWTADLLAVLDAALKSSKPGRGVKAARKTAKAKRATRKEKVAELRAMVFRRACNLCEVCGCLSEATDLEHVHGGCDRRAMESFEGCMAMCRSHHRQKHAGSPSRRWWLEAFLCHSAVHGFNSEPQRKAQAELEALELAASLPMGVRGNG